MRPVLLLAAFVSAAALGACSPGADAVQEAQTGTDPAAMDHGAHQTPVQQAAGEMAAPGLQSVDAGGQAATFENAWIRTPPAGRDLAAGYVTIATREPDALVHAWSQAAERIEMHTMSLDGDIMRMRRVERIETGRDGTALQPGGDHLMIFGLSEEARLSGTVLIDLHFESGLIAEDIQFQIGDRMPGMEGAHGEAEPGGHD